MISATWRNEDLAIQGTQYNSMQFLVIGSVIRTTTSKGRDFRIYVEIMQDPLD